MFKIIALIFFLFSILIDSQFVSSTLPHYATRNFLPVTATISDSLIKKISLNREIYSLYVSYNYKVDNKQYYNDKLQTEDTLFNSKQKAENFINEYSSDKNVVAYYDPSNPKISYLQKGLTNKDLNTLLMLLPINLTSVLVLYLGFLLGWNFNKRNLGLTPLGAGFLGSLTLGIPSSLTLIFLYNLEASESTLFAILFFTFLGFISFMLFKKITAKTIHRYHRAQTKDYNMTLKEGHAHTVFGIYKLKRDGLLPIVMINSLLIMATIFAWAKNEFIFDNTGVILVTLAIITTAFYLYSLTTKSDCKPHRSFTRTR